MACDHDDPAHATLMRVDGLDVSHHNKVNDEAAIPDYRLLSCKATEGATFTSSALAYFTGLMRRRSTPYQGTYHWLLSTSPNERQVGNWVRGLAAVGWLDSAGGLKPGKFLQNDWERSDWLPLAQQIPTVAQVEDFNGQVRDRFGDRLITYAAPWVTGFYSWRARNHDDPLWIARYNTTAADRLVVTANRSDIWQWSSKYAVPGFVIPVGSGIDVNEVLNWSTLDRLTQSTSQPNQPQTPDPPVVVRPPSSGEDAMQFTYNGITFAYDGFNLRWVRSGHTDDLLSPTLAPQSRETMSDLLVEVSHVHGPSPFGGIPGDQYRDGELDNQWQHRLAPDAVEVRLPSAISGVINGPVRWE